MSVQDINCSSVLSSNDKCNCCWSQGKQESNSVSKFFKTQRNIYFRQVHLKKAWQEFLARNAHGLQKFWELSSTAWVVSYLELMTMLETNL